MACLVSSDVVVSSHSITVLLHAANGLKHVFSNTRSIIGSPCLIIGSLLLFFRWLGWLIDSLDGDTWVFYSACPGCGLLRLLPCGACPRLGSCSFRAYMLHAAVLEPVVWEEQPISGGYIVAARVAFSIADCPTFGFISSSQDAIASNCEPVASSRLLAVFRPRC